MKTVYQFAYDEEMSETQVEMGMLRCDMIKGFLENKNIKVSERIEYSEPGFGFSVKWVILSVKDKDYVKAKRIVDRLKRELK